MFTSSANSKRNQRKGLRIYVYKMLRNLLTRDRNKSKEHHHSDPLPFLTLRNYLHRTTSTRSSTTPRKADKMSDTNLPEPLLLNCPKQVYTGENRARPHHHRAGPRKAPSSVVVVIDGEVAETEAEAEAKLTMEDLIAEVGRVGNQVSYEMGALSEYFCEMEQKAAPIGYLCSCKQGLLADTPGCENFAEWRRASFLGKK